MIRALKCAADPSTAVKVLGLVNVPGAGDEFEVLSTEREAKRISETLQNEDRENALHGNMATKKISLDDLFNSDSQNKEKKVLRLIIKADVQGSIEAIIQALNGIESEKVELDILSTDVGNVTVNDVNLASASNGIILGFHSGKENGVNAAAKREGI